MQLHTALHSPAALYDKHFKTNCVEKLATTDTELWSFAQYSNTTVAGARAGSILATLEMANSCSTQATAFHLVTRHHLGTTLGVPHLSSA